MNSKFSDSQNKLLEQYNQYKFQAHNSYMYGQIEEASNLYELAFYTNKKILSSCEINEEIIFRTLDICLDCLEFCICKEQVDSSFFLGETASFFQEIIKENYSDKIKTEALIAFSELIKLIKSQNINSCYVESESLNSRFNILCYENPHLLKNI